MKRSAKPLLLLLAVLISSVAVKAEDWPMWRHDSNRTAITSEQLDTSKLQLHWKRQYSQPQPAWDNQKEVYCYGGEGYPVLQKLSFDIAYQPVVMDEVMYVGSMNNDTMTAVDLNTGEELWKFFTDGPIRFSPVAMDGKIYFGSDDGFMYCLDTAGNLVWKKRGGPTNRKVLGNDRVISVWPVRGAPVIPVAMDKVPNPVYMDWVEEFLSTPAGSFILADNNSDSEELVENGSIDLSSSDLELGREHDDEPDYQIIGLRFTSGISGVAPGSTVNDATIQFSVDETKGGTLPLTVRIYGELSSDSAEFTTTGSDISSRTKTANYIDWIIPFWDEKDARGDAQKTPDLSPIINELASQSGWTVNSPITFIIEKLSGDGIRCAESANDEEKKAVLTIGDGSVVNTEACPDILTDINPAYLQWLAGKNTPGAENYALADGKADQEENMGGGLYNDSSDLEICHDGGEQVIGMRFTNDYYTITPAGTVANAYIQFTVDETKGGTEPIRVKITGDLSGNSAPIDGAYGISSRTRTTTEVVWDIPNWTNVSDAGADQQTPDLSGIINEIIACEGWSGGSAITLIIDYVEGSGIRCAESKDGNGIGPVLVLETEDLVASDHTKPEETLTDEVTDTDVLYFAAGSFPFEGSFTYAVDKETGETLWLNDGVHMYFTENPHGGSEGYNGNGPMGYLCTGRDGKLLVPNGRNRPACFSRDNGDLLFHRLPRGGGVSKGDGGYFVSSMGEMFFTNKNHGCRAYSLENGAGIGDGYALMDEDRLLVQSGDTLFDAGRIFGYVAEGIRNMYGIPDLYGSTPYDDSKFGVKGGSFSYGLPARPAGLLAANGHLIVSTVDGWIYCFGEDAPDNGTTVYEYAPAGPDAQYDPAVAQDILAQAGYTVGQKGNCVIVGLEDGRLAEAIARETDMTVVAFEKDEAIVQMVRERLDACGLYGQKVHIINEEFIEADCPSYSAHVLTTEKKSLDKYYHKYGYNLQSFAQAMRIRGPRSEKIAAVDKQDDFYQELFRVLRPYGGTAVLDNVSYGLTKKHLNNLDNAEISKDRSCISICKVGKLPGAADWTHQHCNVQQTTLSSDANVKLPMGILWYGGSADNTNDKILPRHGHGPSPQVVGGRYYIEGLDVLRCVDVYTGRVLWEKEISNLGQFSNYTDHQAGQLALGDNYISTEDAVYVLGTHDDNDWPIECLVLDPFTGAEIARYQLPGLAGWGMIAVYEDYLIATGNPMLQDTRGYDNKGNMFPDGSGWIYQDSDPKVGSGGMGTWNGSTSESLYVLNRKSGEIIWETTAENGFFHNSIVAGNSKLFAMDRINWDEFDVIEDRLVGKRGGNAPRSGADASIKDAVLTAFDIATGDVVWQKVSDPCDCPLFGSWLCFSEKHDILIECQRHSRDYMEPHQGSKKMAAWKGESGDLLWRHLDRFYWGGPVMLNEDMIITQSGNDMGAVNLLNGEPYMVPSGVTGEDADFAGFKRYGCGTGIACNNMMIFRSGNAGYYDLNTYSGTGNWGGFKAGCTINLMPANGLIVAPEYTRTCGCSYQYQTSCALIHRDDVEQWSCNKNLGEQFAAQGGRLMNVGFNFGAVGDRVDDNGILWMEYPYGEPQAGFNYQIPVDISVGGDHVEYYRHHSLTVSGDIAWVGSSGVEGAASIVIDMVGGDVVSEAENYDVYLYFMEPAAEAKAGDRVFTAMVNGQSVMVDIAGQIGTRKILVKKISHVTIDQELIVTLDASAGKTILSGIGLQVCEDQQSPAPKNFKRFSFSSFR